MNKSKRSVKALGEVSLRVRDLARMKKFYEDVVGLEVLSWNDSEVFFRIADGYAGYSQNLALFDATELAFLVNKTEQLDPDRSTLSHIAFNIDLEDFESEKKRLEGLGVKVNATVHEWLHIRSMYFPDPEGNLLEFVAYDPGVK